MIKILDNKRSAFFILLSSLSFSVCLKLNTNLESGSKFVKLFTKNYNSLDYTDFNSDVKRSTGNLCSGLADSAKLLNNFQNPHVFQNDSNPVIILTWSGKNGVMIALTTMSNIYVINPSKLYRSLNRGRTFVDISETLENDFIRKENGLQVNPIDTANIILVTYSSSGTNTKIYITTDTGTNFRKSTVPFHIFNERFQFNPMSKSRLHIISRDYKLYLSIDSGMSWTLLSESVFSAAWDPLHADILYYTFIPNPKMSSASMEKVLFRYNLKSKKTVLLAQHVHRFRAEKNFLFLTVQFSGKNGSCVSHVSQNKGDTWKAAQLPLIKQKQFYSLLDMTEDMVFVHVAAPGGTGRGNIYTSGSEGILYSLSLQNHLLPINNGLSDFYKVESLPGVYITTVVNSDTLFHSRITFDKGGTWQSIKKPVASVCPEKQPKCNLHIHNMFSAVMRVTVPSFPMSSSSTAGLILAHGNVGDGLSRGLPDVFISNDGGYEWNQPSQLKGPHYLAIGDSGGIIFAITALNKVVDTVKFSLDEGQCWHSYKFSKKKIIVSGISTEPGDRSTDVTIWGWDVNGNRSWMAVTVDFKAILGHSCGNNDYKQWQAHESNSVASSADGCLLGSRQVFKRRKKGSVCINGEQLSLALTLLPCTCQKYDFLCDYGYKRNSNNDCVRTGVSLNTKQDVCINEKEETITTKGYRLVPGDKCKGGFVPPRQVKVLKKSCAQAEVKQSRYGVDRKLFPHNKIHSRPLRTFITTLVVIATLLSLGFAGYVFYKRRKRFLRVDYTSVDGINSNSFESIENGNKTIDSRSTKSSVFSSYHDDSDQDLLVT